MMDTKFQEFKSFWSPPALEVSRPSEHFVTLLHKLDCMCVSGSWYQNAGNFPLLLTVGSGAVWFYIWVD